MTADYAKQIAELNAKLHLHAREITKLQQTNSALLNGIVKAVGTNQMQTALLLAELVSELEDAGALKQDAFFYRLDSIAAGSSSPEATPETSVVHQTLEALQSRRKRTP